MKSIIIALLLLPFCLNFLSCNSPNTKIDKEILSPDFDKSMPFSYKMPKELFSIDTSPAYKNKGQKILLTGTVYQVDARTPASDVVLYYYHTNTKGIYATETNEARNMPKNELGQTHGYIRGWLKTDEDGKYSIYTLMPGTYPSKDQPVHIHISIKDKNMDKPYYIDDFVFDNDKLLTSQLRKNMENRGGSGVIRFVKKDNLYIGERNIYLGLNIPDYPIIKNHQLGSGKNVGEDIISFTPFHAYGPDKGTKTCPICKYGWYHGILYFVGNNPNWTEIKEWLIFLDEESQRREEYLKVYFIYGNEIHYEKEKRFQELEKLGKELNLVKVALTFVPSFNDKISDIHLNNINPSVKNTFILYKRSNIIDKYVDLKPSRQNFEKIIERLDKSANEFFKLSKQNDK